MKAATARKPASKKQTPATAPEAASLGDAAIGSVKIHEGVIASLARKAVLSTEGVSRLAGNALVDNIAEIVGSRRLQSRSITVDLSDAGKVSLEIKLNVLLGHKLPVVAAGVQSAVTALIEETTGMTVSAVDVLIQDVDEEMPADPGDEAQETELER